MSIGRQQDYLQENGNTGTGDEESALRLRYPPAWITNSNGALMKSTIAALLWMSYLKKSMVLSVSHLKKSIAQTASCLKKSMALVQPQMLMDQQLYCLNWNEQECAKCVECSTNVRSNLQTFGAVCNVYGTVCKCAKQYAEHAERGAERCAEAEYWLKTGHLHHWLHRVCREYLLTLEVVVAHHGLSASFVARCLHEAIMPNIIRLITRSDILLKYIINPAVLVFCNHNCTLFCTPLHMLRTQLHTTPHTALHCSRTAPHIHRTLRTLLLLQANEQKKILFSSSSRIFGFVLDANCDIYFFRFDTDCAITFFSCDTDSTIDSSGWDTHSKAAIDDYIKAPLLDAPLSHKFKDIFPATTSRAHIITDDVKSSSFTMKVFTFVCCIIGTQEQLDIEDEFHVCELHDCNEGTSHCSDLVDYANNEIAVNAKVKCINTDLENPVYNFLNTIYVFHTNFAELFPVKVTCMLTLKMLRHT
ncbi:hypothetical protein PR048_013299 [Dryococelus australis]|uniref:Uncharacterized protein n=1 Tax=Dryococelus australis TaxID=614101 RepID=A0ABQ9HRS6_9NEOP|nr:hypothetical protein PR048_013299 [Dryococelus australis]